MKCNKCGNKIKEVKVWYQDYEGCDQYLLYKIKGGRNGVCYYLEQVIPYSNAIQEFVDCYEEFINQISCPVCNDFPFKETRIDLFTRYDIVFGMSDDEKDREVYILE